MSRTVALPRTTTLESLRFTTLVALPNLAEGLFSRRPGVTAALDLAGVARRAHQLLTTLHRHYGDGPIWVNVAGKPTLLVFGADQIHFVLSHAPEPFASDPDPKLSGMNKFQPHALTISRGDHWSDRRRFTEAVLAHTAGSGAIANRCDSVADEEARGMPDNLDWLRFHSTMQRIARRIILGDNAADDQQISAQLVTLMAKANPPGKGDPRLFTTFLTALDQYVQAADAHSLVGQFAAAPASDITYPTHQVIHWMFAMGDTLAINLWRCLALLATHAEVLLHAQSAIDEHGAHGYLAGCLSDAMRLWPSTPALARTLTGPTEWEGEIVPAGTQVMIVNTFNHRDTSRFPEADQFNPTAWTREPTQSSWSFNFFSHGPQACPGADVALRIGVAVLTAVLGERSPTATGAKLNPHQPLPLTLDHSRVNIRLKRRH
ncbi:cytochrome P450 [Mycolicibacterium brisbanense]|uniref:Cytochrome P450 n=1 Tax=Mycolicibacterium brisbanense TaxID=146020 RepID=A0A117I5W0_9MYCO|nr:cytochrome P450 [Mycolicibacterium brisbanense]MCV7160630.1 cytochrome P450 [Mycolicibacterium brisbanense]GAS89085.1 cytochrome P450 [Mycolicibacterium brisbanense]